MIFFRGNANFLINEFNNQIEKFIIYEITPRVTIPFATLKRRKLDTVRIDSMPYD